MKKILFTLMALVCSMSMDAQIIKIIKDGKVIDTFTASEADGVDYEEQPTTGAVTRTGRIVVNWVQLWEDGPKFAEYNVGANSAEGDGGYYCWGGSTNRDTGSSKQGVCSSLSGDDDTATKLWGRNWRMPKRDELQGLIDKCDSGAETLNGVTGIRYRGKGIYAGNSIFLPFAGDGSINHGVSGYYYSSESDNDTKKPFRLVETSFLIYYSSVEVKTIDGNNLCSVRAVLTDGPIGNDFGDEDGNESYGGHGENETGNWF